MRARLHECMWWWWCFLPRASILIDWFNFCPLVTRVVLFHRQNNLPSDILESSSFSIFLPFPILVLTSQTKCLPFALLSESQLPCCVPAGLMLSTKQSSDLVHQLQDYRDYPVESTKSLQQQYDATLHPVSKPTPRQVSMTFMFPRVQRWFLLEGT
jgi:hypothetical protein